jgi:hypothetical protein
MHDLRAGVDIYSGELAEPGQILEALVLCALIQIGRPRCRLNIGGGGMCLDKQDAIGITLNIAVAAPIPSAKVRMATTVKPGDLRNWRRAKRRSCRIEYMGVPRREKLG